MSTPDAPVPPPDSGVRFVDRLFASRLMVEHLLRASVVSLTLLAAADDLPRRTLATLTWRPQAVRRPLHIAMVERSEAEMTYTIDTVQDLVRVLDEHPQWLDALRARMLPLAAKVSLLAEEMRQFKAAADVWSPVPTALSMTLDRLRAPTPGTSPAGKRA